MSGQGGYEQSSLGPGNEFGVGCLALAMVLMLIVVVCAWSYVR